MTEAKEDFETIAHLDFNPDVQMCTRCKEKKATWSATARCCRHTFFWCDECRVFELTKFKESAEKPQNRSCTICGFLFDPRSDSHYDWTKL